ncbi:phage major capsid protein [Tsukamurella soli]|uniref:Phage capsid-like C-terminal domain-containing protein n=1 Tax=Tsukamurella soli TaxID=644556 RepID=A0ABP8JT20_9ACTN
MNLKQLETRRRALEAERATLRAEAQAATTTKGLDDVEAKATGLKARFAELDAEEKKAGAAAAMLGRLGGGADGMLGAGGGDAPEVKSHRGRMLGSPMQINAAGWEQLLAGVAQGQRAAIDFNNATHRKAFASGIVAKDFDGATSGSGIGSGAILPTLFPMLPIALEATRVSSLLPHVALDSPVYEYVVHESTSNPPALTAELATKPVIGFDLKVVTGKVQKLAGTYSHSWELARDYTSFVNEAIPSELTRALVNAESAFLLGAAVQDEPTGTTAPSPDGLLGAAGLSATVPSTDTNPGSPGLRAINKAVTTLRSGAAFAEADTIVLSPNTFGELRGAVDSMGRFILTEPAGNGEIPKIWNLRVCTTTMIADGTALIFDSTQYAKVMVRDSITLVSSNVGAELMSTNSIMHVIEERIGLSVPRPAAGLVLTGIVG